jgi:hypothetical protein
LKDFYTQVVDFWGASIHLLHFTALVLLLCFLAAQWIESRLPRLLILAAWSVVFLTGLCSDVRFEGRESAYFCVNRDKLLKQLSCLNVLREQPPS